MSDNLRKTFADICRGYSAADWNGPVFVKHLSHFEQVDLDSCYDSYFEIAKKKKLPKKEERMEWLDKKGLWTRKNEAEIGTQKAYVENLEKTLKLLFLKSQIDTHKETLEKERKKYGELLLEKENLLGLTCEKYAEQKMLNYYIFVSFYKDSELRNKLFTNIQFSNLDDEEMDELFKIYMDLSHMFSEKNLKRLAVSSFFTAYFNISDDIQAFFGKPTSQLSYNQLNLLYYAQYYKQICQNLKIPDNIREDPEKIEEFVNASNKAKQMAEKAAKSGSMGIVGATKADMEYLGMDGYDPMMKKAISKGGVSSVEEAARL
jgi:hypothetical protein